MHWIWCFEHISKKFKQEFDMFEQNGILESIIQCAALKAWTIIQITSDLCSWIKQAAAMLR